MPSVVRQVRLKVEGLEAEVEEEEGGVLRWTSERATRRCMAGRSGWRNRHSLCGRSEYTTIVPAVTPTRLLSAAIDRTETGRRASRRAPSRKKGNCVARRSGMPCDR